MLRAGALWGIHKAYLDTVVLSEFPVHTARDCGPSYCYLDHDCLEDRLASLHPSGFKVWALHHEMNFKKLVGS